MLSAAAAAASNGHVVSKPRRSKSKLGLGKLFKKDKSAHDRVDKGDGTKRRNSKKRQKVISNFIHDSNNRKKHFWRDRFSTLDIGSSIESTSEESSHRSSVVFELDPSLVIDLLVELESRESPGIHAMCSDVISKSESHDSPVGPKSVTFSNPLVTTAGVGAGAHFFPSHEEDLKHKRPKAKVFQCEATLDYSYADEKVSLPHYNREELLEAQPKKRVFLSNDELAQLRWHKERLNTFRRKLKKKHQKARKERVQVKQALAMEAVQKANERQQRIINQYKMAAPTAQEHRMRRCVKFALAKAAISVALVQRRHLLLQSIVQEADERIARKQHNTTMDNAGMPQSPFHRLTRKMLAHQASNKAKLRLLQTGLIYVVQEIVTKPVIVGFHKPSNEAVQDEESIQEGDYSDHDDDDLDTDDFQFRRLEWAQLSFLAAAQSQARRIVDV